MVKDVTSVGLNVTNVGKNDKERRELKKHSATIHCSNTLSLLQRKISNALLYHAYKELALKEEHEITVKQLCRLIGYQGNNHGAIREAFKGLISTIIEWNLVDDQTGAENWTASSIIASVSLEGPLCYYAYSPRMKQLLHSPSMFGKIDLVIQSKFRSSYGLALYENCIRYRGLPQTKWMDMELFKKLMGIPAGKYDVFRDFKRRVLDKSIDEVNSYSDLIVEPELMREGRKVIKIRFKLKERAKRTRLGPHKNRKKLPLIDNELNNKLYNTFGLTEEQIETIQTEYDINFIQEKVKMVESSKPFKDGKIQNVTAYLLSAIKHNYQPQKKKEEAQVVDINEAKKELEINELKRHIEDLRADYATYRDALITNTIENLPAAAKKKLMSDFHNFAAPAINTVLQLQRHKYNAETVLESPQIKALLRRFAVRELDLLVVASIEEFAADSSDEKRDAWQKLKSFDPDHHLLRFRE